MVEIGLKLDSGNCHTAWPVLRSLQQHLRHLHQAIWDELLCEVLCVRGGGVKGEDVHIVNSAITV